MAIPDDLTGRSRNSFVESSVTSGVPARRVVNPDGSNVGVPFSASAKGNEKTTITSSTSETTIVTANATKFLDVYGLIIANTSASACNVTIKDATGGTTRFIITIPAGDVRGFMLPADSAHKQAAVNSNWTATCSASVASIEVTALYVIR